ncbi:MAG TPA: DUF2239 family protein [Polyangiaceae bacterium]
MEARSFSAFAGHRRIAEGDIRTTLLGTKSCLDAGEAESVLVFDQETGAQVDFDWRGTPDEVLSQLAEHPFFAPKTTDEPARIGPGRPKLGVVSREVTMLPRHWEWLEAQPGGISAALRRLVDEARKSQPKTDRARQRREATHRFMWAIAGNFPGFEEASRALFAKDAATFRTLIATWPVDIRSEIERLSETALV